MKIALVHDYLKESGGAERVLSTLSDMYPAAPIYTAFVDRHGTAVMMFQNRKIVESPWAWFLKIGRFYSYFRFLLPWVWGSLDLSSYDVVVTSCSGYIARGFRVGKHTKVIAYCHTPPRWLYGYTAASGNPGFWGRLYLTVFGPYVRYFDYISAKRVNVWVANSHEVAARIKKFYRKEATVVYPPVEVQDSRREKGDSTNPYYLVVSRLVGAKGLFETARAAGAMKRRLVVVGEVVVPNVADRIQRVGGMYVELRGRVSDAELSDLYAGATAYLALAEDEDFGMTVVEAMAHGVPVLARYSGGYKETVRDQFKNQKSKIKTGVFIKDIDVKSIEEGMKKIENIKWDREGIKKWAEQFSRPQFERGMRKIISL